MIFLDVECTTLQPDTGILTTVGLILPDNKIKLLFVGNPEKEKEVINETIETLRDFGQEPIMIWYSGFDIPFLVTRAIKHNLDMSDIYSFRIIDLCKLVQDNLKLTSYKLVDVCKFLEIEKDSRNTGKDVQSLYLAWLSGEKGAREQIIKHCESDLIALKKVFEKLEVYVGKWLKRNTWR